MKKFLTLLFFLAIFTIKPVFAGNNITITCNNGSDCVKSSELPLFSETNIYPGFTHSQTFSVDNNRNGPCQLKFKATSTSQVPDILSQKILINISGTNNDYNLVNYSLNDLLNPDKPIVSLGHVNKGIKNNYLWSVIFDIDAGNEYQNQISNFSINFNFECDDEEPITTPTPTPTSTSGSVLGSTSSNTTSTQCTNSAPSAPTGLVATRQSDGDVGLTWTETTSEHSGYLLAFGTSPGNYQYGSPDIGTGSSYTVKGLTYGAQYCFYIRSLNGCMPGGRTPEYCVNPGSNTPAAVPTIYQQQVLGDTTENNSIETSNNDVLGSQDSSCSKHWLPILFIVALLINLVYVRLPTKDKLVPIIISLATFLFDRYLLQSRCCFGPGWLCSYFWIGNILSWLVPVFVFKQKKK